MVDGLGNFKPQLMRVVLLTSAMSKLKLLNGLKHFKPSCAFVVNSLLLPVIEYSFLGKLNS